MIDIILNQHPLDKDIPKNWLANETREQSLYSHKAMNHFGRLVSGKCNPPDERGRMPLNCMWEKVLD